MTVNDKEVKTDADDLMQRHLKQRSQEAKVVDELVTKMLINARQNIYSLIPVEEPKKNKK